MANYNISQLPSAAALSGAEQLPLMQGGITKNIAISALPVSALSGYNLLATQAQVASLTGSYVTQVQLAGVTGSLATQAQVASLTGSLVSQVQLAGVTGSLVTQTQLAGLSGSLVTLSQVTTISGNLQTQISTKAPATMYSNETTGGRVLVSADNGKTLIVSGGTFTINTGLDAGFGVVFKGQFSYNGTATVTDERYPYATAYTAALMQTGSDIYTLVGTKP